jgi:hypothetical protein
MTLEEFSNAHNLPPRWLSLRRESEAIVRDPQFWSRTDMQNRARKLAVEASDILDCRIRTVIS